MNKDDLFFASATYGVANIVILLLVALYILVGNDFTTTGGQYVTAQAMMIAFSLLFTYVTGDLDAD